MREKVAAQTFARGYLNGLMGNVFDSGALRLGFLLRSRAEGSGAGVYAVVHRRCCGRLLQRRRDQEMRERHHRKGLDGYVDGKGRGKRKRQARG